VTDKKEVEGNKQKKKNVLVQHNIQTRPKTNSIQYASETEEDISQIKTCEGTHGRS